MRCINIVTIATTTHVIIKNPALNGSSEIQQFKYSDTIEMHIGAIFDGTNTCDFQKHLLLKFENLAGNSHVW